MDSEIRTAYLDCHKTLDSLPADEAADLLNAFTLTDETDYIKGKKCRANCRKVDGGFFEIACLFCGGFVFTGKVRRNSR